MKPILFAASIIAAAIIGIAPSFAYGERHAEARALQELADSVRELNATTQNAPAAWAAYYAAQQHRWIRYCAEVADERCN
jgi:pyrimidine deaminase RibD-like protein